MILVEWAPFDFTPDGRQRIKGLVISSTTPNPLPVDGTNVDKMRNDMIFAPGSVLHVTGKADINWYVANESGVFEPDNSGSGGGGTGDVDDEMSNTSTNAVMNRVIKQYVDDSTVWKVEETNP